MYCFIGGENPIFTFLRKYILEPVLSLVFFFFLHKQLYFCLNTESEYFCHFWQNPRTALTTFIHSDSRWTQKTIYASGVAAVTVGHVCIKQKRACSSFRSWPIFQRLERLWLIFISALEWLLWVLDEWASLLWNATSAARVTVALKPDWSLQEEILLTGSSQLLSFVSPLIFCRSIKRI